MPWPVTRGHESGTPVNRVLDVDPQRLSDQRPRCLHVGGRGKPWVAGA